MSKDVNKKKMEIVMLYPTMEGVGGAENVIIDLYTALKGRGHIVKIASKHGWSQVNERYRSVIDHADYEQLSYVNILRTKKNKIFVSHHRKISTIFMLLKNVVPNKKTFFIHVAHNVYSNLKMLTRFPKHIIAVSKGVKGNLVKYFGVDPNRIEVIHNGIDDMYNINKHSRESNNDGTRYLYPARINKIKNQLSLVDALDGKVDKHSKIMFAGSGEDYEALKGRCNSSSQFEVLGHIEDMSTIYAQADYVLLFSKKEGLPISLIEACMYGVPIVCNSVGGNNEIVEDNVNGFICDTYDQLIDRINSLKNIHIDDYNTLRGRSRQKYLSDFTLSHMVDKYENSLLKCYHQNAAENK